MKTVLEDVMVEAEASALHLGSIKALLLFH